MRSNVTEHVTLFEMSPRDGLQNEAKQISTADKIKLVNLLSATGLAKIETASFVNPKAVPQMADGKAVMAGITRNPAVKYTALTPNMRGFDSAVEADPDEVAVFASASEGFSMANINCSIEESLARFAPVMKAAKDKNIPVRGYVSCVADCPYDGPTEPRQAAKVAHALREMGCYEVSLGDTIGSGTPDRIKRMLAEVIAVIPPENLAGHYHNTKGYALGNIETSLEMGLRTFDASAGGLGGCPFAPGAAGNVATEAVLKLLNNKGYSTGIDTDRLETAALFAKSLRSAA